MLSKLFARISPATISASAFATASLAFLAVARSRSNPSPIDRESWQAIHISWLHWAFAHQSLLLTIIAAIFLAVALCHLPFQSAINRRWTELADWIFRTTLPRLILGLHPLVAAVFLVAVLVRLPTLPWGAFVNDDYGILRVNRTLPLLERIAERHNDHAIPGYRLEVAALDTIFGTYAPGWNLAILANYAISLWLLARVMRQFRIHPLAAAFGLFVFAISKTSSALLTGYYCLSNTLQITAFALAAFLAGTKARETGHAGWDWLGLAFMTFGALIDISGIWILAGVPLLLFADSDDPISLRGIRDWLWLRRRWVMTWASAAIIVIGVLMAVRLWGVHGYLPGASLGYEKSKSLSIAGILTQLFFYLSGGAILQMTLPVGDDSPVALYAAVFVAGAILFAICVRLASPRDRRLLLLGSFIILLFALEVALGRPLTTRSSFWVQHVATAHLLGALVAACGVSVLLQRLPAWFSPPQAMATTAGISAILLATSGAPAAIFYGTKLAGIQLQQARIREIGAALGDLLAAGDGKVKALPVLEAAYVRARYREPRPDNDLCELQYFLPAPVQQTSLLHLEGLNNLRFYDSRGPRNVMFVPDLREACGPEFARALANTPAALVLYGAPIELSPVRTFAASKGIPIKLTQSLWQATEIVTEADGSISFTSDGGAELRFQTESFDPLIHHVVKLKLAHVDGKQSAKAIISYDSTPLGSLEAQFEIDHSIEPFTLDLRRLTPFSVSRQISHARVRFVTPGRYRIGHCNF